MKSWKKYWKDEKGTTMIMVAIALVMIFAFAVLAIDLSMLQLAKTQLQNAADAAALAGAWAFGSPVNLGNEDSARVAAISTARLNTAIQDIRRPVYIDVGDITFPDPTHITVTTHRTIAKGDPITLPFMKVLDSEKKGEMTARATAGIMGLSGTNCLRPFCPPDRWFDANGDGIWNPSHGDFYDPQRTGYIAPRDIGAQVILTRRNPSQEFGLFNYYAVDFPPKNIGIPIEGADVVREWIQGCPDASIIVSIGDRLQIDTDTKADTAQIKLGLNILISQDPLAYWDSVTKTVKGSAYGVSPRIIKVAAFDPSVGRSDCGTGEKCVTVVKLLGVFIEGHSSDTITGRLMSVAAYGTPCDACPPNFLYTIVLTE